MVIMILSYKPSLHDQTQRTWLAVPDTDFHVSCNTDIWILTWLAVKIRLFVNCMQLQGLTSIHSRELDVYDKNVSTPSSLSPTFMYYTKIKETWDMANFCFNLLYFDAVQFMCRRRTGNEKHPLRIIFGVHSFCSCFIWRVGCTLRLTVQD